jgi:hypothetical protein
VAKFETGHTLAAGGGCPKGASTSSEGGGRSRQPAGAAQRAGWRNRFTPASGRGWPAHATALVGLISNRRHAKERGGVAISEEASAERVKGKYGEPEHWDGFSVLFVLMIRDHQRGAIPPRGDGTRCWLGPSSIAETRGVDPGK